MAERYERGRGWVDQVVDPANPTATAAADTRLSGGGYLGRGLARLFGDSPGAGRFMAGTGRGMMDVVQGGLRGYLKGNEMLGRVPEGASERFYDATRANRDLYNRGLGDDTAATAGRIVGQTAPAAVIPGGPAGSGIGKIIGRVAAQAPVGAGLGALTAAPGEDVAENAIRGGQFAAGAAGLLGAAGSVGGRVANAAMNRLKPGAQELIEKGKQFGIKPFGSDVTGNPRHVRSETQLWEHVPGSMQGARINQMQQAEKGAKGFAERTGGGDPGIAAERIKGSLAKKEMVARRKARDMYQGDVLPRADALGEASTSTPAAFAREVLGMKAADMTLKPGFRKKLEVWASPRDLPYSEMHYVRSGLGDQIRGLQAKPGNKNQIRILEGLKRGLEKDMDDLIMRSGDDTLKKAYQDANRYYAKKVAPLQSADLTRARTYPDADVTMNQWVRNQSKDRAKRFYNALDKDGRLAVRGKVLADAIESASRYEAGRHIFSPTKFANTISKLDAPSSVFFGGAEKQALDDLAKVMRTVKRAGEVGENPPTGQRLITGMSNPAAGMALGGFGAGQVMDDFTAPLWAAGISLGSGQLYRLLNTSPAGIRLMAASKDPVFRNTSVGRLLSHIGSQATRAPAVEGNPDAIPR